MADMDGILDHHEYHLDKEQKNSQFTLKGSNSLGWGEKNRLSKIFNPKTNRTVMLAVDHGYFMGPTSGLERIDLNIVPLIKYSDALMCTRGILRSLVPPTSEKGVVLRVSSGPSILKELSNENISVSIEESLRLNVAAVAVQVFVGGEYESRSIDNLSKMINSCKKYDIPVLGVTAVGRELVRDAKYMRLATRICAELGASYVKTYFVDKDFETVTASCPIPIVIAGGKKLSEYDALSMCSKAIKMGASGVDMGRNIFQSKKPESMIKAVCKVVHEDYSPEAAYDFFQTDSRESIKD